MSECRVPRVRGSGVLVRRWSVLLLVTVLGSAGCAVHDFVLPTGAGMPAPDAASAWAQASASCRGVESYQAELRVSGRVNEQRLHGTIHGAVTAADEIYLLLPAPIGQPVFILQGTGDAATLVLLHDKRTLTGRADDIVEALTGLKQGPRQLLAIFTGCVSQTPDMVGGARYGALLKITMSDANAYLQERDGRWVVAAAEVNGLVVAYRAREGGWPREVHLASTPSQAPAVSLTIFVDQLGINDLKKPISATPLRIPPGAAPMTLDELRATGPLRQRR